MTKICMCGRFDRDMETSRGQVVKTRMIYDALCEVIGANEIIKVDLYGGLAAMPRIFIELWRAFCVCKAIIMLPAYRGLQVLTPLFMLYNCIFHRKLHYVVIGGWLSSYTQKHRILRNMLQRYDHIYVETSTMKHELEENGFCNIKIMKNFKVLNPLQEEEVAPVNKGPFRVCTFSRVMEKKGIEDAICVIKAINERAREVVFTYDIYGEISPEYYERFRAIEAEFPDYIKYRGLVPYDKSVEVLRDYFVLLFPTKFPTEGIPGTIIDAYASGLPVIAAQWESYCDVIDEGETGIGYELGNQDAFEKVLLYIAENPQLIGDMRKKCIRKAKEFMPEEAMRVLLASVQNVY